MASETPRPSRPRPALNVVDLLLPGLVVLSLLATSFTLDLVLVSRVEHRAAQTYAFARLRNELARGTAPLGQTDRKGNLLPLGTPVALLEIPRLHVKEAVLEGTSPHVLTGGPGHLRSTVLPGQLGTSAIYGRATAFGGPFGGIHTLQKGDLIKATIGGGTSTFSVIDVRRRGDPLPPRPARGRVTLVTATGWPYVPTGIIQVDADLTSAPISANPLVSITLGRDERPLAVDTGSVSALVLWLEAMTLVVVAAVWSWRRWGRAQTWIVYSPLVLVVGYYVSDQVVRLLPNLL